MITKVISQIFYAKKADDDNVLQQNKQNNNDRGSNAYCDAYCDHLHKSFLQNKRNG